MILQRVYKAITLLKNVFAVHFLINDYMGLYMKLVKCAIIHLVLIYIYNSKYIVGSDSCLKGIKLYDNCNGFALAQGASLFFEFCSLVFDHFIDLRNRKRFQKKRNDFLFVGIEERTSSF